MNLTNKPYCGECIFFKYEDTDGYGCCDVTRREQRCDDKCVLNHMIMTPKETEKVLHHYQKYRRGGKHLLPHPYVIGQAIDSAIRQLRARNNCKCCAK